MTNLLASADPLTLQRRIGEMIDAGRAGAARPLLAALRTMQGDSLPVATLSARLLVREGDWLAASAALDDAVGLAPDDGELRKMRAEARMNAGDLRGAAEDAADAVLLDRTDLDAKALLGLVLGAAGAIGDALECLNEAVDKRPGHAPYLLGLAKLREQAGDPDGAEASLRAASRAAPMRADLRSALILALLKARRFDEAVIAGRQAARAGAADAVGFGLLGHALSSLGRHDEAAEAYGEALKLAPEDMYVRHMVAASGVVAAADQAPDEYLRSVFDGYADRFEPHLIALGYRVPGLIRAELEKLRADGLPDGPVLDLGCGTGMLGVVLAADVFCYAGDLRPALRAVAARLAPGGVVIFSVELLEAPGEAPWRLGRLARYAHREAYVAELLCEVGLQVETLRVERLRDEAEAGVSGLLVRARL